MNTTATDAALSAAPLGSHAAAVALDWPVLVVLIVAALAGLVWLTWKIYLKTRP